MKYLTPKDIAGTLGTKHDTVLGWIRSKQLVASDIGNGSGKRPTYRISEDEFLAFMKRREVVERTPDERAAIRAEIRELERKKPRA